MQSKFSEVFLKVKYSELDESIHNIEVSGTYWEGFGNWRFYLGDKSFTYTDEQIEKDSNRFKTVLRGRVIKSVKIKEAELHKEFSHWDIEASFDEPYILRNAERFTIEYED